MSWESIDLTAKEIKEFDSQNRNKKKCKFLVDENLGEEVVLFLKNLGWNAKYIGEYGLRGHDDIKIYQRAYKEDRMLLTHDMDFLDNKLFPLNTTAGIIILPGGNGNHRELGIGLNIAINIIGNYQDIYRNSKIVISNGKEIMIMNNNDIGIAEKKKYKLTRNGVEMWVN